jgi:hypothetical protein
MDELAYAGVVLFILLIVERRLNRSRSPVWRVYRACKKQQLVMIDVIKRFETSNETFLIKRIKLGNALVRAEISVQWSYGSKSCEEFYVMTLLKNQQSLRMTIVTEIEEVPEGGGFRSPARHLVNVNAYEDTHNCLKHLGFMEKRALFRIRNMFLVTATPALSQLSHKTETYLGRTSQRHSVN